MKVDNAWTPGYPVYLIASRTFNDNQNDIWDWNGMYLHVMIGMYTDFMQQDGWGVDYASPTLEEFAEKLKDHATIKHAWFEAVREHQRLCYGPVCTWEGKAAVISPFIIVKDSSGNVIASYYYRDETLSSIYERPIDLVNYYLDKGYTVILGWVYDHQ